jgi:hypothetical protein
VDAKFPSSKTLEAHPFDDLLGRNGLVVRGAFRRWSDDALTELLVLQHPIFEAVAAVLAGAVAVMSPKGRVGATRDVSPYNEFDWEDLTFAHDGDIGIGVGYKRVGSDGRRVVKPPCCGLIENLAFKWDGCKETVKSRLAVSCDDDEMPPRVICIPHFSLQLGRDESE